MSAHYMFAVDRKTLIRSLEHLRRNLCHYSPGYQGCDCKFASYPGNATFPSPLGKGEVSGCAEIEQAIRFFNVMTPVEFDRIYKRQSRIPADRTDRIVCESKSETGGDVPVTLINAVRNEEEAK